jgi:YggT family protein
MNTVATLVGIVIMVLQWVIWLIIAQAILSWLVAFNVVNLHNGFIRQVVTFLDRVTEPLLRPIRKILPDLGGIDLSPMVLILVIIMIQRLLPSLLIDTGVL